jgi:hypothetical protein
LDGLERLFRDKSLFEEVHPAIHLAHGRVDPDQYVVVTLLAHGYH